MPFMITDLQTLPITLDQYRLLVDHDTFAGHRGQVELIYGRIVKMNPQGPMHSDPIDEIQDWSHEVASKQFRIRTEKPIEIPNLNSSPEPDIAWVTRRRYGDRHPQPADIHFLVEVSYSSQTFDRGEKQRLYAEAGITEYWTVDVPGRRIIVMQSPSGTNYQQVITHEAGEAIAPACLPTAKLSVARLFSETTQD